MIVNLFSVPNMNFTEVYTEVNIDIDRLIFCTYIILLYFVYISLTCIHFLLYN